MGRRQRAAQVTRTGPQGEAPPLFWKEVGTSSAWRRGGGKGMAPKAEAWVKAGQEMRGRRGGREDAVSRQVNEPHSAPP